MELTAELGYTTPSHLNEEKGTDSVYYMGMLEGREELTWFSTPRGSGVRREAA